MRFYQLIFVFAISQLIILNQAQEDTFMATPTAVNISYTTKEDDTNATLTNNMTATIGSITLSLPFAPSPTTFVFTHFPLPTHTGSSSSMMSSARPSQSAPFPDDTIGKYGRLHINNAPPLLHSSYSYLIPFFMTIYFCIIYHN
jgi:hypothetical protein